MILQRNRQYKLIIGDSQSGDALEIDQLQVTFDISKSTNNKNRTNSATIEVTNLSEESLKVLDTDYPAAVFEAGYLDTGGPKRLFAGQVTNVSTRKSGTDIVTSITMGSGYTFLNHETLSDVVPPGNNVQDAIEKLRKAIGADRGVYNGVNLNNEIIYGYPLSGTPKEMLDELAEKYQLDWQLDDGVLYVHDNDRAATEQFQLAYVISPFTGLIERPYRVSGDRRRSKKDKVKKPGVQLKVLLNPEIKAGDIIQIEEGLLKGWYKVDSIRHTGGWRSEAWYTEIKGSSLEKVIKDK
jgi:hypothetical protein